MLVEAEWRVGTWEDGRAGVGSEVKLSLEANGRFDFGERALTQTKQVPDLYVAGTWTQRGGTIVLTEDRAVEVYFDRLEAPVASVILTKVELTLSGGVLSASYPVWWKNHARTVGLTRKSSHPSRLAWPRAGVPVRYFE